MAPSAQPPEAARREAEIKVEHVHEQIRSLQLRTYDVQLARVRETWRRNPGLALSLLNDTDRCPPALRDFAWGYFHSRAQNDRATLTGHIGRVNAVAWSQDGRFLATGGLDKTVRTWEGATGKPLRTLYGHSDRITAVAWSANGQTLASGSVDTLTIVVKDAFGNAVSGLAGTAFTLNFSGGTSAGALGTVTETATKGRSRKT